MMARLTLSCELVHLGGLELVSPRLRVSCQWKAFIRVPMVVEQCRGECKMHAYMRIWMVIGNLIGSLELYCRLNISCWMSIFWIASIMYYQCLPAYFSSYRPLNTYKTDHNLQQVSTSMFSNTSSSGNTCCHYNVISFLLAMLRQVFTHGMAFRHILMFAIVNWDKNENQKVTYFLFIWRSQCKKSVDLASHSPDPM